ncbi:hypothetical protein AVEN_27-1 [Araneus ventricosus]|uniref:Peptidase S1 domain-containing protein n=1 Tax=Araneus ventricosus TaxID=182803 RepID=A0A4Y2RJ38_ARAVE|nr:hypothetical protein AVEN_27-1 [Araneus ventricosus]
MRLLFFTEGRQILREGFAQVVNPRLCREPHQPKDFYRTIICTFSEKNRQLPCHGDSGSAIFGHFEKKFYALGITSKANSSICDTPDTFTKISFFMDWIKLYVGDLPSA